MIQAYLEKIQTIHKRTSPYHSRTNGKVESLNGLIESMIIKYLLKKSTKLWDLYLDQALFACRIHIHAITHTSSYYLVYGQHPRLLGDDNHLLDVDVSPQDYHARIEAVQSARQEASRVTYERALRAKAARDALVQPHNLAEGE